MLTALLHLHSGTSGDGEEHAFAMGETAALLQVIAETRVLNPHEVAKSSQLSLVLIEFKANDPKRFRQNIRVSPHTMHTYTAIRITYRRRRVSTAIAYLLEFWRYNELWPGSVAKMYLASTAYC